MEGLRELRGMVVFPAEETTRQHSCHSIDYADYAAHLAYTTFCAICLMKHTNYAGYADKITYTRLCPAGPRLREHSCSFTAIIAFSCRKSTAAGRKTNHPAMRDRRRAGIATECYVMLCRVYLRRNSGAPHLLPIRKHMQASSTKQVLHQAKTNRCYAPRHRLKLQVCHCL